MSPGPAASSRRRRRRPRSGRGRRRAGRRVARATPPRVVGPRRPRSASRPPQQRAVTDLDGVGAPGHLQDRGPAEVPGEALRVDGRGGDDELQLGAARQQLREVAEQEVDGQAALVRLVDDEGVVLQQLGVALDLGQQDAVGHDLDQAVLADGVGEADGVADALPELGPEFLRDALGDRPRGDPPRLGVPDPPAQPPPDLQADLRQLGRLARPGLPGDDDHLVLAQRRRDPVLLLADRQLLGVVQGGDARGARGHPLLGGGRLLLQRGQLLLERLRRAPGQARQPPAQAVLVAQRDRAQPLGQRGGARVGRQRPGRGARAGADGGAGGGSRTPLGGPGHDRSSLGGAGAGPRGASPPGCPGTAQDPARTAGSTSSPKAGRSRR